jgi:predicted ArsR family transcriptional regulator
MTLNLHQTFPVSAGLLDPRHVQTIGRAVWVYLWFLNRVTRDEQRGAGDFVGIVLNGRPVSIDEIAEELGFDYHACRRYLANLVKTGYVERKKTGAGMFTYAVTKSKKWAWKRQANGTRNLRSSASEKQADLFPPTDLPTEQKVLSGSENPQSKICTQGADPQSRKCNSTEQNLHAAERGSRARSQETTKVLQGKQQHPPETCARKLIQILSLTNTMAKLKTVEASIVAEAAFRGCSVEAAAQAIAQVAIDDQRRGVAIDRWYFEDTKWRPTSKSNAPRPLPIGYVSPSEQMRRLSAGAGR